MIHIQPFSIYDSGQTHLNPAFLSELPEREALFQWCREKQRGWFRLERVTDYFHGSCLWQAVWPMSDHGYRFVLSRNANPSQIQAPRAGRAA
jgi:hypothetical protein